MNNISILGKFLDQPNLIKSFNKTIPGVLITGAAAYGLKDTFDAPEEKRGDKFVQNAVVLSSTALSALIATRGLKLGKIKIPGLVEIPENNAAEAINGFIKSNSKKLKDTTIALLEKSKEKILGFGQVRELIKDLKGIKGGEDLLNKMIPPPKELGAKEIAGEIGRLSLLGAIPVVGGVAGGTVACYVTGEKGEEFKKCSKNKIKEGVYQYLANIVLCNVGAAGALGVMETPKVKNFIKEKNINSKFTRAGAMVAGIAAVGVLGGSAIANFIGENILNKLFGDCKKDKNCFKNLYAERHPELLDAALHVDDIATVGVLSGFKWIEPALPIMYSVSGYRAGMGYRNGDNR